MYLSYFRILNIIEVATNCIIQSNTFNLIFGPGTVTRGRPEPDLILFGTTGGFGSFTLLF